MDYLNDSTSPLVQLVSALEQLGRVEQYLYGKTYRVDGALAEGKTWSQWYADTEDAVAILRDNETLLRSAIATRIGATLNDYDHVAAGEAATGVQ